MARASKTIQIALPSLKIEKNTLFLIGTEPLIVHAFPEKARKQMLDKQMQKPAEAREARDPYAEVEAARYILPDGRDGVPAVAFKSAAVTACTSLADITKIAARQAFRVAGIPVERPGVLEGSFVRTALVPLVAGAPLMREDMARLGGPGSSFEVRYRPEFFPWGVEIDVYLNTAVIGIEQLVSMFRAAGLGVGVGDYRPEKDGVSGTWEVVGETRFAEWRKEHGL